MSREEKKAALQYLMYMKKMLCDKIKGRGCADGRKQRYYLTKDDTSAPTTAREVVFLTRLIDTMEHRHVETVN